MNAKARSAAASVTPGWLDVAAACADIALEIDARGFVAQARARDAALAQSFGRDWQGRSFDALLTVESRPKAAELLGPAGPSISAPRQLNHPWQGGPDLPVQYIAVRREVLDVAGGAGAGHVLLGRDLRPLMAVQMRLVEAQQSMERDYWRYREAETRFRALFQASNDAVLVVDGATLKVAEANPAALALIAQQGARAGTKPVGAMLSSLLTAESAGLLNAAVAAARSGGQADPVTVRLVGSSQPVQLDLAAVQQGQSAFLLVRLQGLAERPLRRPAARHGAGGGNQRDPGELDSAFVRASTDAIAITDGSGRIVEANPAFARLAQLASSEHARGEPLDRWLGSSGVELPVLLTNLRETGSTGLWATELRGTLGLTTEVEVGAARLAAEGEAVVGFSIRDLGRRLAPAEHHLPTKVPASVQQLTELVGRVPIKQIVAETSDLIERLSIEAALTMTRDNRAMAAQLLGLSRQSLYVKMRRFGIGNPDGDDA